MNVNFFKYQGTGNDFILIDNREGVIQKKHYRYFSLWCDRHFGIGADGLILLQRAEGYDFQMKYFNSDGRESTMCGNGGRCIIQFASDLGIIQKKCSFMAIDGPHSGEVISRGVTLRMSDVKGLLSHSDSSFSLDTGSPHYVRLVKGVKHFDVERKGRAIRHSRAYRESGINVNFAEWQNNLLHVRTYERGVESETLSCGTGVVASALVWSFIQKWPRGKRLRLEIETTGGPLQVRFMRRGEDEWTEIDLTGPAKRVFSGQLSI